MTFDEIYAEFEKIFYYNLFSLDQKEISIAVIFKLFLIILIFVFISRILKKRFFKRILDSINIEEGLQFTLIRMGQYLTITIGVIVAFQFVGIDLSALAVIFGFLSVGIGFGLQNIASNFISGLILLFERPINVGDRITVGDTEGDVENIQIRSTSIRTLNNITIIVPNSEFVSNQVTNWSHGDSKIRIDLPVGVSYSSDMKKVIEVLKYVADNNKELLKAPAPEVLLIGFGDSSIDMQLRFWINDPKRYYGVRSDINFAIVEEFRKNGIEIPFPQRDLNLRDDSINLNIKKEQD